MAIADITARLLADLPARAARLGRPVVTLSYAQSFDGSLSARRGAGLGLSGPESKLMTHQLRAAHNGILVGIGTVLADDPRLTARLAREQAAASHLTAPLAREQAGGAQIRDPRPVVLDRMLRIPPHSRLLARTEWMPWLVCGPEAPLERRNALEWLGARVIVVRCGADGLPDLAEALPRLAELGLDSLMVEGGSRVLSSFLRARLVDQAVVTVAPVWIGGLPAAEGGLAGNGLYPAWEEPVVSQFGRDWVVWGRIGEERYETAEPVFSSAGAG